MLDHNADVTHAHAHNDPHNRPYPPLQLTAGRHFPDIDLDKLARITRLPSIRDDIALIQMIRMASLDDTVSRLDPETLDRIRNPRCQPLPPLSPTLDLAITTYLALEHSSRRSYEDIRRGLQRTLKCELPSFHSIEKSIAELTGVEAIENDMCWDSCMGFTGPDAHLQACSRCHKPRYDQDLLNRTGGKIRKSRTFLTYPLATQVQAAFGDWDSAKDLSYRVEKTHEFLDRLFKDKTQISSFEDYIHGTDYLEGVLDGKIQDNDISDVTIYVWILLDYSPDKCYKKKRVLIGGVIPGPNKPSNIESFLFPGFHHLSALQREGLQVWNAYQNTKYLSRIHHLFPLADAQGLIYYNALLRPQGSYHVLGCDHNDIPLASIPQPACADYSVNLEHLVSSTSITDYERRRKDTGIVKPPILLGLQPEHTLPIPRCMTVDMMHEIGNLFSFLVTLWRGESASLGDRPELWNFSVFLDSDVFKAHGKDVADCGRHLSAEHERMPRDLYDKRHSQYKMIEWETYGLGYSPALLYEVLPENYWRHLCKLVRALRLLCQYQISREDLEEADRLLSSWVMQFEELYYEQREDRLHFVRHIIHQLTHYASEVYAKGPPIIYAQWTMERTIGNLGREIRQPSHIYENLSREALRRCQVNALKLLIPELDPSESPPTPRVCEDLGDGFMLLHTKSRYDTVPQGVFYNAITRYLGEGLDPRRCYRWGRLKLPNGQVAHSAWRERLRTVEDTRISRNVKFLDGIKTRIGKVDHYTHLAYSTIDKQGNRVIHRDGVALICPYSVPDGDLLDLSVGALCTCALLPESDTLAINVKQITSLVAMIPHCPTIPSTNKEDEQFFLFEKPGFDVTRFVDNDDSILDDEAEDEESGNAP
ncbi:hypothetical protein CONPUDRAFT_152775 [Coniophora puteana RWD-64-598 SS2]|uniref:Uncharacterized protein n=1 Tax=Coniophora puteana (strain RWD-64-598) TaxID=741705 RepID=A0A5M3MT02_CONPW|nr:uncharacterized protein CONPUDRAFT_152775 [Coniophora puteana RWD-64-598 SS2]EIW81874.1 hypothetical protein CONPUDRAFT_152775 [Coniophora puteana RWD-64-598 SS2]